MTNIYILRGVQLIFSSNLEYIYVVYYVQSLNLIVGQFLNLIFVEKCIKNLRHVFPFTDTLMKATDLIHVCLSGTYISKGLQTVECDDHRG